MSRVKFHCLYGVITILTVAVVALLVAFSLSVKSREEKSFLITNGGENENNHTACPSDWIRNGSICFYFSEDSSNWTFSQTFCMGKKAQLARFDSLEELDFLKRYMNDSAYWIGLHRKSSKHSWRWTDNTEYNKSMGFIRGEGECAYLSDRGISSGRDQTSKKWICSKPKS